MQKRRAIKETGEWIKPGCEFYASLQEVQFNFHLPCPISFVKAHYGDISVSMSPSVHVCLCLCARKQVLVYLYDILNSTAIEVIDRIFGGFNVHHTMTSTVIFHVEPSTCI